MNFVIGILKIKYIPFSVIHISNTVPIIHWEKFFTREMKVRIEVVHIQSQLVVQIEQFVFLNEIEWWDWAD